MAATSLWQPTMQGHYTKLPRALLTGLLLMVAISGVAVAGSLEDALAAHDRGDDAAALRLIRPLAGQGNAEAQYNLGNMYFMGQGVPRMVPKLQNGFASPLIKGTRQHSTILVSHTSAVTECRRTTRRL
jgi:hypothetical protein